MFDVLRFGLPQAPSLAHRLDRDTSGCLVLGRLRKALRRLGALFASGRAAKTYWAIVRGTPPGPEGVVDLPLRKINRRSGWRVEIDPTGYQSVTHYRVAGRAKGLTWLELSPRTGRTHQIRVHCAWLGCPILGDPNDGASAAASPLQMLHARRIELPLYPNRGPIVAEAPVPPHMREALAACGFSEAPDSAVAPEEPDHPPAAAPPAAR